MHVPKQLSKAFFLTFLLLICTFVFTACSTDREKKDSLNAQNTETDKNLSLRENVDSDTIYKIESDENKPEKTDQEADKAYSRAEKWQEGVIRHAGRFYRYNNNIKTYLFLGIDNDNKAEKAPDYVSGGQSDAMYLLVVDDASQTVSVISINRNTMTDIVLFDMNGKKLGTFKAQICLQHGYGDGLRVSCLHSVDAVTGLFYNIPVTGYISLNMGGIAVLNDSLGGVAVTVSENFDDDARNVHFKAGETVKLSGTDAYSFLRARDTSEFDSAGKRMERQKLYIDAMMAKLSVMLHTNKNGVLSAYKSVEDYIVTNIDFARLIDTLADFDTVSDPVIYDIPGETVQGKKFEEFHVDEDAFYDLILQIFYQEVEH